MHKWKEWCWQLLGESSGCWRGLMLWAICRARGVRLRWSAARRSVRLLDLPVRTETVTQHLAEFHIPVTKGVGNGKMSPACYDSSPFSV